MTIHEAFSLLKESIYTIVGTLEAEVWVSSEPAPFSNRYTGTHKALNIGDKWGGLFDCGWFHFTGKLPQTNSKSIPVLLIDISGELLLTDNNGNGLKGLTNRSSTFDRSLGEPVKHVFRLSKTARAGNRIEYWADAACNDLFGELKDNGTLRQADIALCNEDIRRIYYDFEFLINLMTGIPEHDTEHKRIKAVLEEGVSALINFSEMALTRVIYILENFFSRESSPSDFSISAVGHSHLDLAWLWPIRETRRKIGRTLYTVLELMNRYPDYVYGISQPQLLTWVKEDYPNLFQSLKQKVVEGRIEVQGAMWVEADTNLPSGESLVRQIIYGKGFWMEEFGVDINNLWLPDVFGYSGALPQILKQSGVKYFSTMKLAWNTINKFPFHSFHWKGIDGSSVLTHMLPEETYNSPATPKSVLKIMNQYHEKEVSDHALMVFGIGDGGGGPGAEHLERLERINKTAVLVGVKQKRISDFFSVWASQAENFPTWKGELYLEKHQGTYTTEGLSKKYNRKMELNLREIEFLSVLSMTNSCRTYPAGRLEELWKEVLLYQFHDILPGSSIKRVYDESWERLEILLKETGQYIQNTEMHLIKSFGYYSDGSDISSNEDSSIMAFNSLSWEITEWVSMNGRWMRITIPSMGYAVESFKQKVPTENEFQWDNSFMANGILRIEFSSDGSISSIFDVKNQYQVLVSGENGNKLAIYRDSGDAWDFPADYREGDIDCFILCESVISLNGPDLVNHQVYRYRESVLTQDVVLTANSRRIDFRSKLSWSSPGKMVRTSFPVDVPDGKAMCEIQFGAIERPIHNLSSWDEAKDEISAHSWIDISNGEVGAALLNDSKYGHRVKNGILDLCLLRSVPYPGPVKGYTDLGEQSFVYSLFPHSGDYGNGGVVQAAHELNSPPSFFKIQKVGKNSYRSFFSTGDSSLIISTVKKAENSDSIIIRLYESAGKSISTWLTADYLQAKSNTGGSIVNAELVNLLEVPQQRLIVENCRINLKVKPYELISVKLSRENRQEQSPYMKF